MRSAFSLAIVTLALSSLTGCGNMTGAWKLDSVEPADAPRHYAMSCIMLNEDGSYTACAETGEKKIMKMSGKYTKDDDAKKVTFTADGAGPRTYSYKLSGDGLSLMAETKDGKTMTAHYDRCDGDDMCSACCCPKEQCQCQKK